MEIMESYDFWTLQDLMHFCEERKDDDRAVYYWGWLDNFDGELYTIEDLANDASEDWFINPDGTKYETPSTVYVFG